MQQHTTWEEFFLEFWIPMQAAAYRFTHRKADAEDLVQDVVCNMLRSVPEITNLDQPLAYVLRSMRNQWISNFRKQPVRLESLDDPLNVDLQRSLPIFKSTVQRDLENKQLLNKLSQTKGRLSDRERLLLRLMIEGLSYEEIAAVLNEDLRIIRYECSALKNKLRYRNR